MSQASADIATPEVKPAKSVRIRWYLIALLVIGGIIAALAAVAYTVLVREPIKDKTAAAQTESRTDA